MSHDKLKELEQAAYDAINALNVAYRKRSKDYSEDTEHQYANATYVVLGVSETDTDMNTFMSKVDPSNESMDFAFNMLMKGTLRYAIARRLLISDEIRSVIDKVEDEAIMTIGRPCNCDECRKDLH